MKKIGLFLSLVLFCTQVNADPTLGYYDEDSLKNYKKNIKREVEDWKTDSGMDCEGLYRYALTIDENVFGNNIHGVVENGCLNGIILSGGDYSAEITMWDLFRISVIKGVNQYKRGDTEISFQTDTYRSKDCDGLYEFDGIKDEKFRLYHHYRYNKGDYEFSKPILSTSYGVQKAKEYKWTKEDVESFVTMDLKTLVRSKYADACINIARNTEEVVKFHSAEQAQDFYNAIVAADGKYGITWDSQYFAAEIDLWVNNQHKMHAVFDRQSEK